MSGDEPAAPAPSGSHPLTGDLVASEARFRALTLATSQMVWRTDAVGNVQENSDAWQERTGQRQEQSNGWGWLDVVHPDDRDETVAIWTACLREGRVYEHRYRILVDGRWRWVLARAAPVRDSTGAVVEWIGTSIDVDAVTRAERERDRLLGELQQELARTRTLQAATADLAAAQDLHEVALASSRHLGEHLDARTSALYVTERSAVRLVADPGGPVDLADPAPSTAGLQVEEAVATGRLTVGATDPVTGLRPTAVPLLAGGDTVGALLVGFDGTRTLAPADAGMLHALAGQVASSVARVRTVDRLREVAVELQQGLVPGEVPALPLVETAAVYRAGGDEIELVGGDWFDVLEAGDRVALVIGDVMGRGVRAATAMAGMSAALRALAVHDPRPSSVLAGLDAYVARHSPDQLVTLLYVLVDPVARRVELVSAGHPPPLLVRGTEAAPVPLEPGPPLGLGDRGGTTGLDLHGGDALVLLTDGVIEARGEEITAGLDRAAAAAARASRRPAAVLAAGVAGAAGDAEDDVTVLVCRLA